MNEDRKEQFINSLNYIESSRVIIKRLFNRIRDFETVYDKDLAEMSLSELSRTLYEVAGLTRGNTTKTMGHIRQYVTWCMDNGFLVNKNILTFREYDTIQTERFRKHMVSSPLNLKQRLGEIYFPPEYKTTHCIPRTYLWLLFMGLTPEESVKVQSTDVDLEKQVLVFNNNSYKIFVESLEDFRVCCQETELIAKVRLNLSQFKDKRRKRLDGSLQLLRLQSISTVKKMETKISSVYKEKYIKTDACNLTSKKVFNSGVMYKAYLQELEGRLNINEFLKQYLGTDVNVLDFPMHYEIWKRAFDLD